VNGIHDQTIADVSTTLVELLKAELDDIKDRIALASPKTAGANLLTLFLYKVLENPFLKNDDRTLLPPNAAGLIVEKPAPLTVDLYYLLSAHSGGDAAALVEAHRALSRAMRVLYDHAVLQGSVLRSDSANGLTDRSVIRVTLNPITMEDMTRIWSVFPDTPYEISVTYLASPVEIELTEPVPTAPVVDQVHEQGHREPAGAGR
jgi:uncharacterized protein DUF4255